MDQILHVISSITGAGKIASNGLCEIGKLICVLFTYCRQENAIFFNSISRNQWEVIFPAPVLLKGGHGTQEKQNYATITEVPIRSGRW